MKEMKVLTTNQIMAAIMIIFLSLFDLVIFLIKDVWTEIDYFLNQATSINFNWTLLIFILTLFHIYFYCRQFKKDRKKTNVIGIIFIVISMLIHIFALYYLFDQLQNLFVVIKYTIFDNLKLILFTLFIVVTTYLCFKFKLFKKKYFFLISVFLIFLLYFGYRATFYNNISIITGPYLQSPTQDSIVVGWISDSKAVSWIEYGTEDDLSLKAFNSNHGIVENNNTVNKVKISNLEAGKKYYYRVASKKIVQYKPYDVRYGNTTYSETYSFTTLDEKAESTSFLVISDMHENINLLENLIVNQKDKAYDFVVFNGDIFDNIKDERQLRRSFLDPVSKLFARNVPFVFIRGNHETRGKFASELINYVGTDDDKYYYNFNSGPAAFLALDTGEDKPDTDPEYSMLASFENYRATEEKWLSELLKEEDITSKAFTVAFSHVPLNEKEFTEVDKSIAAYQSRWLRLLEESDTDLLLHGHWHNNEIYDGANNMMPIILSGGEANLNNSKDYLMLRVEISEEKMKVDFIDKNNQIVNSYSIDNK
ncbi:MAG: metallophosphoesterase [Anaerorhabdus sp.]